jgi:hypothetical protein
MSAAAALALTVSPTIAMAQKAAAPVAPATEQVKGSEIRGGFILPLIGIIAIIIAIILLTDNNKPKSP